MEGQRQLKILMFGRSGAVRDARVQVVRGSRDAPIQEVGAVEMLVYRWSQAVGAAHVQEVEGSSDDHV